MPVSTVIIDPVAKTVTAGELPDAGYMSIRTALGDRYIDVVRCGQFGGKGMSLDLWVDDEGLLIDGQQFFKLPGYPSLLGGRAVFLLSDREGESHGLPAPLAETLATALAKDIVWLGDNKGAEAAIQAGELARPKTTMNGEVIWEWSAS
jgi:hypothetical protein